MMHFWRKEYFKSLNDVAAKARKVALWADYADFCEQYEKGLRSEAFTILERFISSMERAPFKERRDFVSWLSNQTDGREGRHMLIPHPLQIRVVEPTLLEWTAAEPRCSEPHMWLGGYDHLREAVELDPDNQLARRKLIIAVLSRVGFNTHELPDGYLGEVEKDLGALSEAEKLLHGLSSEDDRIGLAADIAEQRRAIAEYLRRRKF
jgi:hypothetical protein